jgi:hypothetical protein
MILLELLKQHCLLPDAIYQHAGHANTRRCRKQFLKATKSTVFDGIANPSSGACNTHAGENGGKILFLLSTDSGRCYPSVLRDRVG